MSSKEKIDVDMYREFCLDLYVYLLEKFPRVVHRQLPGSWISITPTVHKMLAHSWELIESNDRKGLGVLDESGLEGCNKILRNVRTSKARKLSQNVNLVDTLRRMWLSSDPIVNSERNRVKPVCSTCSNVGHTSRSCTSLRATAPSEDDALFLSFIVS